MKITDTRPDEPNPENEREILRARVAELERFLYEAELKCNEYSIKYHAMKRQRNVLLGRGDWCRYEDL